MRHIDKEYINDASLVHWLIGILLAIFLLNMWGA